MTSALAAQIDLLDQLAAVVSQVSDEQFVAVRAEAISGSVGSHVRHCLDHVSALVGGLSTGRIDYDSRRRGTAVESRREAALAQLRLLTQELSAAGPLCLEACLEVVVTLDRGAAPLVTASTVGRELAFVASHTIHHFAVLALLLKDLGLEMPDRFGYAPSTPVTATAA